MGSSSSKKQKKQVVGYKYSLSMQLGLCHGTIDAIRSIWFSDRVAWSGDVRKSVASKVFGVNNPGLFGGEDAEGGISGTFEIGFGSLDQELSGVQDNGTYIGTAAGTKATHYRGLAVLNLHNVYIGTNPYMKDISVEVERYWADWYPEVAKIGLDANPAHIIYECCVNDQWGLGYSPDLINDAAFRAAALKLYNEGFGLSLAWTDQTSVDDFINEIISHIDGDFFYDQNLGQWRLKLVRDTDEPVFTFNPDNCKVQSTTRRGIGEIVNQLYVKYVSRATEDFVSVAIQDLASIESQNGTSSATKNYRGIREESLALRVCQRDLQTVSAALASAELTSNRQAWHLSPGDVVTLNWPAYKITSMQCRVIFKEYGDSESGDIRFSLIEDVFGKVDSVFGDGTVPGWEDQTTPATLFDKLAGFEIPFWYASLVGADEDTNTLVGAVTVLPVTANKGFRSVDFYTGELGSPAGLELVMSGGRTASGLLALPMKKEIESSMKLDTSTMTGVNLIPFDSMALIGEGTNAEIVRVKGAGAAGVYAVTRGLLDTQPLDWPSSTRVYFISPYTFPEDLNLRPMGSSVTYRAIMQTQLDSMKPEDAQTITVPVQARQGLPYPPANIRIDDHMWPESVDTVGLSSFEVSWSTRNRLIQVGEELLRWDEGNVTPEEGTTYSLEVVQDGQVMFAYAGISSNSQMVPTDGIARGAVNLRVWSVRDGLTSYQVVEHVFELLIEEEAIDWAPVMFPGRRLALIGDSLTAQNTLHLPGNGSRYEVYNFALTGFWPRAAALFNHRLELEPGIQPDLNGRHQGLNTAIAGSRVMNWWLKAYDNQNDGVLDQGPMYTARHNINAFDVAVLMGGTNDLAFNRTAGQVLADIRRAVSELARAGKWVFVLTITSRTTDLLQGYTLAQQAVIRNRLLQVNAGLKRWVEVTQPPNVFLVDAFAATVGPNGLDPAGLVSDLKSATGTSVPGNYMVDAPGIIYHHDGLHLAAAGAQAIGEVLAKAMITAGVPPRISGTLGPLDLGPNILANPTFNISTGRPPTGLTNVLGRALGLGPPLTNASHAVGPDVYGNVGLGYTFGQVPDYWFVYRASNSDDESYSNFNEYLWKDLSEEFNALEPYLLDSTWTEGALKTSVITVEGKRAFKIDFRTPVTGNKNEAFVVRAYIPRGQHGVWDDYNNGDVVVPNTAYSPGQRLAAEAEVRLSNVHKLHTSMMTVEFLSIDSTATSEGDFSTAGSVISGVTGSMNFWPPSDIGRIRQLPQDVTLHLRTAAVVAPTPAPGEDQQYARLNFQFACDASEEPASVTVIILEPSMNTLSALDFPPTLPDQHGLGFDLGQNLGGAS